jgi:NADPH:quinone reductase-like Zn-dependent oxidoreductase
MVDVPERMRAAYVTELGAADAIPVGELPVPAAGPTDVLVRVVERGLRGRLVLRVAQQPPP